MEKNTHKRERATKIAFVCYPESCDIVKSLDEAKKKYVIKEYAYILHNQDLDVETGESKKSHYHIYVDFGKQTDYKKFIELFNTKVCESVLDKIALIRYFIHYNDDKKHQYDISEVVSNFNVLDCIGYGVEERLEKESNELCKILDYIASDQYVDMNVMLHWVLKNKIYATYRRSYSIIKDYVRTIEDKKQQEFLKDTRFISKTQFEQLIDYINKNKKLE